jgi:hypothetical protein
LVDWLWLVGWLVGWLGTLSRLISFLFAKKKQ